MPPFLQDALDIARFRVKALDHYAYDWWQPVLWLTLLGTLPALTTQIPVPIGVLLVASVVLTWISALIMVLFFTWWLKKNQAWNGQGSLFPLVVLASSSQLLGPIMAILPAPLGELLALAGIVYQLLVLTNALTVATGVPRRQVALGFLTYVGASIVLAVVMTVIAMLLGLLPTPPNEPATPASIPALNATGAV